MFPSVSPTRVGLPTLEEYLPLVLRLFELSPEGVLPSNNKLSLRIRMDQEIHGFVDACLPLTPKENIPPAF